MRSFIALTILAASALAAPIVERTDGGNAFTGNGGQAVGGANNAYTYGKGPNGQGGGIANDASVLNAFSDNAGDGGVAKSGDSHGGAGSASWVWTNGGWQQVGGKGGDAYTGLGGNANGGNKGEYNFAKRCWGGYCGGYGYRGDGFRGDGLGGEGIAKNLELGNIATGNAGDGGDASSGDSYGGDAGVPVGYVTGTRY